MAETVSLWLLQHVSVWLAEGNKQTVLHFPDIQVFLQPWGLMNMCPSNMAG